MTKQSKKLIDELPYYKGIKRKYRYKDEIKDKAWSILSDFVRCRDFLWFGTCVATGQKINHWRDTDAGHFYSMSGHGALLGFSELNIHAQKSISNKLSSMSDGAYFKEELIRRYGEDIIKELGRMKRETVKADDFYFIERIEDIYAKFQLLKSTNDLDFPEYLEN